MDKALYRKLHWRYIKKRVGKIVEGRPNHYSVSYREGLEGFKLCNTSQSCCFIEWGEPCKQSIAYSDVKQKKTGSILLRSQRFNLAFTVGGSGYRSINVSAAKFR